MAPSPHFDQSNKNYHTATRQQFREMLATLATKTQTKIPSLNGRVAKACTLVLMGDVELHPDGTAIVASLSEPSRTYRLEHGVCSCKDYPHAPEHLCCHRLSVGFTRKLAELLPPTTTEAPADSSAVEKRTLQEPVTPLPEARASVNVHLTIAGRQVQLTLRDHDEARLLARLEAVLAQYPQPQPPAPPARHEQGWCAKHNCAMKQTTKEGRSWWSHRTAEGWCKGR
jgi:hypothetical protein